MSVVPLLKLGDLVIASIQSDLSDSEWGLLRDQLLERTGDVRAKASIVDVSAMELMDSFAGRTLTSLARMLGLRGVRLVVVGIQPDVAFAMAQLGLRIETPTALDLEDGLALLGREPPRVEREGQ